MKQIDIKKLISYIDLLDRDLVSRKIKKKKAMALQILKEKLFLLGDFNVNMLVSGNLSFTATWYK